MSTQQLKAKLYKIACESLAEANRNNPFINKSEAMRFINETRKG